MLCCVDILFLGNMMAIPMLLGLCSISGSTPVKWNMWYHRL